MARCLATLPMRLGGLGLRSATRMAPAAYWASWADAFPMISARLPSLGEEILEAMTGEQAGGCIEELVSAAGQLDRGGFLQRPDWLQLRAGARPPVALDAEPGEWQHGWQFHASSPLEHHFRETVLLARPCPDDQVAHLRSHSGPGSSDVLCGAPSQPEFVVEPHLFRALVMERLRLPLDITDARCERLDFEGRHRGACPRSGRLRTRALGPERSLARVCREAGASVRCNTKLRDMNVAVSAMDERSIEVLASGLPLFHGAQLAIDVTLRSPLTAQGMACAGAAQTNGAVLHRARRDKERKYQELVAGDRCRLVVVALETGGRWSQEAVEFVNAIAGARARSAPPLLRGSAFFGWRRRWMRMLSVSCGRSFASSLVSTRVSSVEGQDGLAPDLADLFG